MAQGSFVGRALLAAMLIFGMFPAGAAEKSWYLGAAYSEISRDPEYLDFPPALVAAPSEQQGFKVMAGWRKEWLAVEAAYSDLGSQNVSYRVTCAGTGCPTSRHQQADALSLSALATLPIGPVELFGRAGIARWKREQTTQRFASEPSSLSESEDTFTYGAGLQYRFKDLALRLEHEILDGGALRSAQTSLGVTWSFF